MSTTNSIDSSRPTVEVEPARPRQTERPTTPFRDVLAGGAGVLLAGAEVAVSIAAGPVLAAAVRAGAGGIAGAGAGGPALGGPAFPVSGTPMAPGTFLAAGAGNPGATGLPSSLAGAAGGSTSTDMAQMQAMQRESQAYNLQLLNLQEEVQQENRRFTMLTNVLRAKHDTAKAALGNIRS